MNCGTRSAIFPLAVVLEILGTRKRSENEAGDSTASELETTETRWYCSPSHSMEAVSCEAGSLSLFSTKLMYFSKTTSRRDVSK